MKLVIGGAYQGKLDYVVSSRQLSPADVFECGLETISLNLTKPVIDNIQWLFWAQQQQGIDSLAYLQAIQPQLMDKIIICDDVSSGVVPIDTPTRLWRETTGRCGVWLARQADTVTRVFCGIATCIKP